MIKIRMVDGVIKFICDGCKKEEDGTYNQKVKTIERPSGWFMKKDNDGHFHACSYDCVKKISKEKNTTDMTPNV